MFLLSVTQLYTHRFRPVTRLTSLLHSVILSLMSPVDFRPLPTPNSPFQSSIPIFSHLHYYFYTSISPISSINSSCIPRIDMIRRILDLRYGIHSISSGSVIFCNCNPFRLIAMSKIVQRFRESSSLRFFFWEICFFGFSGRYGIQCIRNLYCTISLGRSIRSTSSGILFSCNGIAVSLALVSP